MQQNKQEPRYIAVDDDGLEYELKRPKWMKPTGEVQIMMLDAVGRIYYKDRREQGEVNEIAKQALSLTTGVESTYPLEWVINCCDWVKKKRSKKPPEIVQMRGLISLITDRDKKTLWMDRNRDKYKREETWDDIIKRREQNTSLPG